MTAPTVHTEAVPDPAIDWTGVVSAAQADEDDRRVRPHGHTDWLRAFYDPHRCLAGGETVVSEIRPNGRVLVTSWRFEIAGFLFAMAALGAATLIPAEAVLGAWAMLGLVVVSCAFKLLRWAGIVHLVTSRRVITTGGTLSRHTVSVPLETIRELRTDATRMQRLLRHGTVHVVTIAATGAEARKASDMRQRTIKGIPRPDDFVEFLAGECGWTARHQCQV